MGTRKLSAEEQRALRANAKDALEQMERRLADPDTVELLDAFKNKFNICETVYKTVLEKHQLHKGKKSTAHYDINMSQVPYALEFAGYEFERELLSSLFGSNKTRGRMSVKKLRNAVTHGLDRAAIAEIERRRDELFGYMDSFLDTVRSFDQDVEKN